MTLEHSFPIFSELNETPPSLCKGVSVRSFKNSSVIWLNEEFWLRRGKDINSAFDRDELCQWLLRNYAFTTESPDHPESFYDGEPFTAFADRYGGSKGTLHGGSGRSLIRGAYNAKGVGVTPLCNNAVEWNHSHGSLWMEEAIRECIYSIAAAQEFPHGGNSVVALIDTGDRHYHSPQEKADGIIGGRRAILVRENSVRIGHMERSIYFGEAGTVLSDQYQDALRVKDIGTAVFGESISKGNFCRDITQIFDKVGTQIGFGRAHKLFHGDYISSNICVSGALLDFGGGFRVIHDWTASRWRSGVGRFGEEFDNIGPSVNTVVTQLKDYLEIYEKISVPCIINSMKHQSLIRFSDEISVISDATPSDDPFLGKKIKELLLEEFDRQQEIAIDKYELDSWKVGNNWIYSGLSGIYNEYPCVGKDIRNLLMSVCGNDTDVAIKRSALHRIKRWAKPRILITREGIGRLVWNRLHDIDYHNKKIENSSAKIVSDLIYKLAAAVRKNVWGITNIDAVLGFACKNSSIAWLCQNLITNDYFVRIEGTLIDSSVYAFGSRFNIEKLTNHSLSFDREGRISFSACVSFDRCLSSQYVTVEDENIFLPPFRIRP